MKRVFILAALWSKIDPVWSGETQISQRTPAQQKQDSKDAKKQDTKKKKTISAFPSLRKYVPVVLFAH